MTNTMLVKFRTSLEDRSLSDELHEFAHLTIPTVKASEESIASIETAVSQIGSLLATEFGFPGVFATSRNIAMSERCIWIIPPGVLQIKWQTSSGSNKLLLATEGEVAHVKHVRRCARTPSRLKLLVSRLEHRKAIAPFV